MPIQSFACKTTQHFFSSGFIKKGVGWAAISKVAARKLDMLNYASFIEDLRSPPSNRLELLKGELRGYYSIRINDQWRIVFKWSAIGPIEVKICDYH